MIFQMNGRIEFSEFYNGKYISLITTPAPDPYSQPSKFKVNSESQLGAIGQEVSLDVTVSGFVRESLTPISKPASAKSSTKIT